MADIIEIFKMLNWHSSFGDQLKGIELARQLEDLSPLILPLSDCEGKSVWENCARALFELSDDRLEQYLPSLLEWLQDLNWPGALIIRDRLNVFSGEKLKRPLENAVEKAKTMPNEEGLMWLDYLSELLDNTSLVSNLSYETLTLLKEHYHNWANWYNE